MAITFCTCGQPLATDIDGSLHDAVCPRCGRPAGVATALALASFREMQDADSKAVVFLEMPYLFALLVAVYACAFLQGVLKSAVDGEAPHVFWPWDPLLVLRSAGRWLACFLAGPVV